MRYRSIRTTQEVAVNSSERYSPRFEVPVFSFPFFDSGDFTPSWSPDFDITLASLSLVVSFKESTSPLSGAASVFAVYKKSAFGTVEIIRASIADQPRVYIDFSSNFTLDKIVSPYDSLYCKCLNANQFHETASVSLAAESIVNYG